MHERMTWLVSGWSKPRVGEPASGDFWLSLEAPGLQVVVLGDVLGHGPQAATDALAVQSALASAPPGSIEQAYQAAELAASKTRGCALFLATLQPDYVESLSVGSMRAWLIYPHGVTVLPRQPGVVGRGRRQPRHHRAETPAGTWLVACSDGIRSGFCPGTAAFRGRTPLEVARRIVEGWSVPEDDATCVVALNTRQSRRQSEG